MSIGSPGGKCAVAHLRLANVADDRLRPDQPGTTKDAPLPGPTRSSRNRSSKPAVTRHSIVVAEDLLAMHDALVGVTRDQRAQPAARRVSVRSSRRIFEALTGDRLILVGQLHLPDATLVEIYPH
jgi:hypothetical protein